MPSADYYKELRKPSWAPPAWLFGPVWSVLYIMIFISFGYVLYLFIVGDITFYILLPFILNLIFNLAFTPIQFRFMKNGLAAVDIILTVITLIWALYAIYPYASWVSYINIPYAIWALFAASLQLTITVNNMKK